MRKVYYIIFLLLLISAMHAQRVVSVSGKYTYLPPEHIPLEQAKHIAIDRARIQALADEFGTIIAQNNSTFVTNDNSQSNTSLFSLGESEVKGEWLEDVRTPSVTVSYEQGALVVKAQVWGRAREIIASSIQIRSMVLCNGTDARFAHSDFRDGDALYLLFSAPVDGYVCVYLVDEEQNAYCLLPYARNKQGNQHVTANQEYVFFSAMNAPASDKVDEYALNTPKEVEHNVLYTIFSPNGFTKAVDGASVAENIPRQLTFAEFQKWLARCRTKDKDMIMQKEILTIRNK